MNANFNTTSTLADDGGGGSGGSGTRPSKPHLYYDPLTGTWEPVTPIAFGEDTSNTIPKGPPKSNTEVVEAPKNVDSKKKADKEYIEAEFNVLTGEMKLTPTEKSICIRVNDTVKIDGLGKNLSGLYFVSSISRTLSKDNGYSHSFSLIKNGFGDTLKKVSSLEDETRKGEVSKQVPELKIGDSVKIVGDDAVYSNAHDGVKVPAWVKKRTLTVHNISADSMRVLLMPINSWTYIKYVQKV